MNSIELRKIMVISLSALMIITDVNLWVTIVFAFLFYPMGESV